MSLEALANWLNERNDIALFAHVNPDGDACGCVSALTMALRSLGKRVLAFIPGGVPAAYRFLPQIDGVVKAMDEALPFTPMCALSLDISALKMLGMFREIYVNIPDRAALDHHESNGGFSVLNFIDSDSASCGELVMELIALLQVELTPDMANWLFTAVSTDTGHFNFENTTPEAFEAAAFLTSAGADVPWLTRNIYRTRSAARTRLLGAALSGLKLVEDGKIAYAVITGDMFRQTGALREDTDMIINYLIEISGVKIGMLVVEREKGAKLSFRSLAPINVARDIAVPLGGGGHERAAGATVNAPLDEAVDMALTLAKAALC